MELNLKIKGRDRRREGWAYIASLKHLEWLGNLGVIDKAPDDLLSHEKAKGEKENGIAQSSEDLGTLPSIYTSQFCQFNSSVVALIFTNGCLSLSLYVFLRDANSVLSSRCLSMCSPPSPLFAQSIICSIKNITREVHAEVHKRRGKTEKDIAQGGCTKDEIARGNREPHERHILSPTGMTIAS